MSSKSDKRSTRIDLSTAGLRQDKRVRINTPNDTGSKDPPDHKRLRKKVELSPSPSLIPKKHPSEDDDGQPPQSATQGSPWKSYEKLYQLQFGDSEYFTVAEKKSSSPSASPVVIVKSTTDSHAADFVRSNKKVRHARFVALQEVFCSGRESFLVFEFMPLSLSEVAGHPLLNELRLEHNNPTMEGAQEHIGPRVGSTQTMKAIAIITMELIQGYAKEDGNIGIDNPENFPLAVGFLSATEYTSTAKALASVRHSPYPTITSTDVAKHPMLQVPWHRSRVAGLVSLANIWASRGFKYPH